MVKIRTINSSAVVIGAAVGLFTVVVALMFGGLQLGLAAGVGAGAVAIVVVGQSQRCWTQISRASYLVTAVAVLAAGIAWGLYSTVTAFGVTIPAGEIGAVAFGVVAVVAGVVGIMTGRWI